MKRIFVYLLLSFVLISCSSQITQYNKNEKGINFKVEELKLADKPLKEKSCHEIVLDLLTDFESEALQRKGKYEKKEKLKDKVVPQSIITYKKLGNLVNFGYQSFFQGVYTAYMEHRPLILAPDDFWLLICQGFSMHVNENTEKLRDKLVDFEGKKELIVEVAFFDTLKYIPEIWEGIFPKFSRKIDSCIGNDLVNTLKCDFSTSTIVEQTASEITIMSAMKNYFEYTVSNAGCGIPEITLLGTSDDWEKVLKKALKLKNYDLDWWIDELEPILKEFIETSKGNISQSFWNNMFKYHEGISYKTATTIDGWFVKFFPYDTYGKRLGLDELVPGFHVLPKEIVSTDLKYFYIPTNTTTMMELFAGFIGMEQNPTTLSLKPKIGWYIKKK